MKKNNLTRKELAVSVTKQLGLSNKSAMLIVDTIFACMQETLVSGESIKLVQFGTLMVNDKAPRQGRNPKTGEPITISKRKTVSFRPSKRVRELLND